MTFLAPTAGLIAAAIAVPGLVFFYLLKLRRRPLRVSSTLLWQRATHDLQVNAPLRWLRLTWLFVLQLLALLALIAALARPAIEGAGPEASRIVLIIDRSASMSARDGRDPRTGAPADHTRLDEARARAEDVIERLRYAGGADRARAMVVALGADARAVTGFTDSPALLRDAVRAIAPSDQPGDLQAALRLLASLNAGKADETQTRERTTVYLFSDGSFAPPAGGGPFSAPGLGGMDIRLVPVGPAPAAAKEGGPAVPPPVDNLGIVAVSARRDHEDPAIARIFVRVQNAGAEPVSATLQLRIGGNLVDTCVIEAPARAVTGDGRIAPGQTAATFEVNHPSGGLAVVTLTRPDILASDNTAAVVLGEPARPGVLVVAPEGRADPFLLSVLEAMDLQRLGVSDLDGYEYRARTGGERQGDGLGGVDLIIFDRVTPRTLPRVPTISFGAGLPIPGLHVSRAAMEAEDRPGPHAANFLAWRRTHPVLRYVSLDPIVVNPPMLVSLPSESGDEPPPPPEPGTGSPPSPPTPPPPPQPSAPITASVSLAEGPDGPLIGLVEQGQVRRIIVGFELARSTWGPDVSFPVFMANAVEYLTLRGEGAAGRAYTTSEPISVVPAAGASTLRISGPLSATVDVPEGSGGERPRQVPIGVLERAGVYRVEGAAASDSVIAVNLADPTESALATAAAIDIAGAGGPATAQQATDAGPREIWHWFVLLALALASIEWLIYAWRMRP